MRNRSNSTCPDEILEWIPWYPDQGLTPSQRGAVEAHAAGCTACREEISVLQGSAAPTIELPDAERVFAQVLARIEDDGVEGPSRAMPASAVTRPAAPARPGRGRGGWSRPAALAAGLGLAVLCTSIGALGTAYFLGGAAARDASYTTAAAPQASAAGT
nr:zf-HC2 domain-containing protein [Myxococcota bacterium]